MLVGWYSGLLKKHSNRLLNTYLYNLSTHMSLKVDKKQNMDFLL